MRTLVALFCVVVAVMTVMAAQPALAGEKEALRLLETLYNLKGDEDSKMQAAQLHIRGYACSFSLGFTPSATCFVRFGTVAAALEDFARKSYMDIFADRTFGNGDGKLSVEELNKFRAAARANTGLRTLLNMMKMYAGPPPN